MTTANNSHLRASVTSFIPEYIYLGDRLTRPELHGARCRAVRNAAGKCRRGRNGVMSVEFEDGQRCTVLGRRLRKIVVWVVNTQTNGA